MAAAPARPIRKAVSLATDCSGMETPVMALRNLGVPVKHLFACDVCPRAKATIMANCPPETWYDDLTARDNKAAPAADLYVAGFPCQPFSMMGKQQGFADEKGRGTVFFKVREYIACQKPAAFVLENVSGLMRIDGGRYFRDIMESLEALPGYKVSAQLLNTRDHGVPQNRNRIYFVGIRKACDKGTFEFPEPLPPVSIEPFLEPRRKRPDASALPPKSQSVARSNVVLALKRLKAKGRDPLREPWVIDCDSTQARMSFALDRTPCMTCRRADGHWISNRGRRMNKVEMMRLQGMPTPSEGFKVAVTEVQLGKQIGNAMSCNVLERLFVSLLPAVGLVPQGRLHDRYAAAALAPKAQKCLAAAKGDAAGAVAECQRAGGKGQRQVRQGKRSAGAAGLAASDSAKAPTSKRRR
uniref:DNA (cytosine-5-)-methyltransferase n=1 Tax=Zooxanthella nutricula TaxID=1333877 RepID=A0A6U6NTH1_9DINO